jgi:CBS domain-containing protein
VMDRSTPARLEGVKALVHVSETDLDALVEAHGVFLDLIASQQVVDVVHGMPPSNTVLVKRLSAGDRDRLRRALTAVKNVDDLARDLLFNS